MAKRLKLEEGWTTLFLVWSMLTVTAAAIMSADLTEGLELLVLVGTMGLLTGLALSKSHFSGRTAHTYAIIYGLAVVAFMVGRTLDGDLTWRMRVLQLAERQAEWMQQALNGGRSRDNLIFVLQTAGIFWLLGYTAAWYTFRKSRVWFVVLPTGLVLLSVVYYYLGPRPLVVYLAAYALLALLYVSRTHLLDRERSWRLAAVRYERNILVDFMRASLIVGVIALLLASNLPVLGASPEVSDAISGVNQPWRRFQDSWTRLFSSLRSYGNTINDPYADTMVLGGPRNVGTSLIMDVYVDQPLASVYWQGVVLDTYDGEGLWGNQSEKTISYVPEEGNLELPFVGARAVVTQTIVNYIPNSSTIYGAPEILSANREMAVDVMDQGEGTLSANWLRSRFALRQGDSYQVTSRVSTADLTSLRQAPTIYPETISGRYLQLPDTITDETRQLAARLAAPHDTIFDKVIAIRNYLREEIAYNDQIAAPPIDVEPVHYTLFVSKEGYCTYYASAMAVMLRSLGIPARIVNGYAQGEYVADNGHYRVRADNAHTWVEVYFTGYGWIQFEPTASIPVVDRPEGGPGGNPGDAFGDVPQPSLEELLPEEDLNPGDEPNNPLLRDGAIPGSASDNSRRLLLRALGGGALLLVAGGLVLAANEFNRKVEADVDKSYGRLTQWARWIGIAFRPADTPYERADRLSATLPDGERPIHNLTHQYVLRRFSKQADEDDQFDPRSEWSALRPLLLRESLRHWLRRFRR